MFAFLNRLLSGGQKATPRSRTLPPRGFRPALEMLENRLVQSRSGREFNVTQYLGDQAESANASALNGRSVVVWTDHSVSNNANIKAQLYDEFGVREGSVITVASTPNNEHQPAVAMNGQGDF